MAMLTRIAGGRIVDPTQALDAVGDLWLRDGAIVAAPADGRADETLDASGLIVMAGAIDIHSHILRRATPVRRARPSLAAQIRAHGWRRQWRRRRAV